MGLDPELFTTNPGEGFIQVVQKKRLVQTIRETADSIGIVLSGWVNHPTYRLNGQIYVHNYIFSVFLIVCILITMNYMNL